jgi:CheY-like chemotaxis protein
MEPSCLRVLVVEDDFIQALQIADTLTEMKCEVVGPVSTMHQALQSLSSERLDAIVTDLDLNGLWPFL